MIMIHVVSTEQKGGDESNDTAPPWAIKLKLLEEEQLSSDNILLDHLKEDDSGHVSLNIIIK